MTYNHGFDVTALIAGIPEGAEQAVLKVLRFHVGRDGAISRGDLLRDLHRNGWKLHERELRATINQLRKHGAPICSTGGQGGGYWLAADWDELSEFIDREHRARIADLSEQVRAMSREAERRWGRRGATQFSLFDTA
jgi:hypothetical protein